MSPREFSAFAIGVLVGAAFAMVMFALPWRDDAKFWKGRADFWAASSAKWYEKAMGYLVGGAK